MTSAPSLSQVRIPQASFDLASEARLDPALGQLDLLWIQLIGSPVVQGYCNGPNSSNGCAAELPSNAATTPTLASGNPTDVHVEPQTSGEQGEQLWRESVDCDPDATLFTTADEAENVRGSVASSLEFWEAVASLHAPTAPAPDKQAPEVHTTVGEVAQALQQLQTGPEFSCELNFSLILSPNVTSTTRAQKQSIDIIAAFEALLCGPEEAEHLTPGSGSFGAPGVRGGLGRAELKLRRNAEVAVFSVLTLRASLELSATGRRG